MTSSMLFQIQSFIVLGLIYIGLYFRRKRQTHIKIMTTAIIWDVLLILQIELSRKAIARASKAVTNPAILNIHVSLALLTVLFYVAMIITGRKLIKGQNSLRPLHKTLGYCTTFLRTVTLITSFFTTSTST